MATTLTDELRVPLLAAADELEKLEERELGEEDGIEVGYRIFDIDANVVQDRAAGGQLQSKLVGLEQSAGGDTEVLHQGGRNRKKQFSGSEMIVAVFVVAFDTKKGQFIFFKVSTNCGAR